MENVTLGKDSVNHHIIADLHGIKNANSFDDIDVMKGILVKAAKLADMTVVKEAWYKFQPMGLTGVIVLSTSHISVHYWPENEFLHCDIFTCNDGDPEKALEEIVSQLKPDMGISNILHLDRSIYKKNSIIKEINGVSNG